MSDALVVFAKPPIAGNVKTRLQSVLSAEEAAQLYRAFLADSVRQFGTMEQEVFVAFSEGPVPDVGEGLNVGLQRGADLAERLRNAFLDHFAAGRQRIVVVGTDHPSLPTEFVVKAFEALREPDSIVIGPSEDGGYYLVGMNEYFPIVFDDMTFSHHRVFEETVDRAASTRATLTILPMWYDVDTPRELPRLWQDLTLDPDHAPATLDALAGLARRYKWE